MKVELSSDNKDFVTVGTWNFGNPINMDRCEIPTERLPVNQMGRFVKLVFESFYGLGSSAQFLDIMHGPKRYCTSQSTKVSQQMKKKQKKTNIIV